MRFCILGSFAMTLVIVGLVIIIGLVLLLPFLSKRVERQLEALRLYIVALLAYIEAL
jgi:predicted cation transporter